jgi:uncharacterized protein
VARVIETLFIAGPTGKLEAILEEPEEGEPRAVALVCHPHPQHGGTMHNKVVYRIARGMRKAGFAVLRFNYRGVNLSEGKYDHGNGEVEDARACLTYLRDRYPDLPYTLAGFSFGSRVALRLGCPSAGADRIIAVGFPTRYGDVSEFAHCAVPRVFLHSTNDQYGPKAELEAFVTSLIEATLHFVEAKDHFFTNGLDEFEHALILSVGK